MAERQRKASDKVEQPPVAEVAEGQRRPPATADPDATNVPPAEQGDQGTTTKIPREMLLSRSERYLGIPQYELLGALEHAGNTEEELTLNAARKAHEEFLGSTQNPTEDEEG